MSEVVKLKISSAVAPFVRPGVTAEKKLSGIQTAPAMEPSDRLTLIFCLLKDTDEEVKTSAEAACAALPKDVVLRYVGTADCHPSILNVIAKFHHANTEIAETLLTSEQLPLPARQFLERQLQSARELQAQLAAQAEAEQMAEEQLRSDRLAASGDDLSESADESMAGEETPDAEIDEESEEFLSKYKVAMVMGIGEKIKMALTGDKEWRSILIKDANKLVSGSVIKNPRITDAEILNILKVGVQNDEIIRLICANKEWVKNYLIRKALISCPKTPLANSLRYLGLLTDKDLAGFAKSKNISSVVSTQAKRLLLAKKKR